MEEPIFSNRPLNMTPQRTTASYPFHFATIGELGGIERTQPDVFDKFGSSLWERLRDCPNISEDFPVLFYLKNNDGKIVCRNKALPDILYTGNKSYPWAWTGDTFTEKEERKKGLAETLIKHSNELLHRRGIGRGIVFSNDITLHIYQKCGFNMPGYVNRYLMIKRVGPFLKAHIKNKLTISVLDNFSAAVLKTAYRMILRKNGQDATGTRIYEIPVNEETLLRKNLLLPCCRNEFRFDDSLENIRWKIRVSNEKVENQCRFFLLENSTTGEPLSYFVLRTKLQSEPIAGKYKDFRLMTVMDYGLYNDEKRIAALLLKQVIKLFWKSNAEILELITSSENIESYAKNSGMVKIGKGMSFAYSIPERWRVSEERHEIKNWELNHFSGDAFSF